MIILWRYLQPHRRLVFLSLLLAGVAQLLVLFDPIVFGWIIDAVSAGAPAEGAAGGTADPRLATALRWLALAVAIAVVARAIKAVQEYVTRLMVQRFGTRLFNDGLRRALRQTYDAFEERGSGETLSLLLKVRTDCERFVNAFINIAYATVVGVGFLAWYAVTQHWALVPVFAVGALVMGGLSSWMGREIRTQQRSIVRETTRSAGFITESLRNIGLIRALGLTFPEIRRLQEQTERIFALEMLKVKRIRLLSFLQGTTLILLRYAVLFVLLWLMFRDSLSVGQLIAMQFISLTIVGPLMELGNLIVVWRETEASLAQFDALMQRPIERRPAEWVAIGPVERLAFDGVVFQHGGQASNAIDGVSFEARLGDTIAFVGPSGSGKSTLVKLLLGLYRPVHGEIRFNDVPTTRLRYNEARRQVGYVSQETQLFNGTIRDNLRFVQAEATDDQILAALAGASAAHLVERSPDGLDTRIGEGGMRLSGGERQRIAIARALLREPRLLIFDEATSALDSIAEAEVTETVRAISASGRRITILIAHRLSTVRHASTIHVLERGRIVEQGGHDALVAAGGLYYAMWRQQIGERR